MVNLPDRSVDIRIATEFLEWVWVTNIGNYSVCPSKVCMEDPSSHLMMGQTLTDKPKEMYPYHFVALPRFSESLGACEKIIEKFAVSYNFQLHVNKNHSVAVVWDGSDNTPLSILQGTGASPAEAIVDLCVKYMGGQLC